MFNSFSIVMYNNSCIIFLLCSNNKINKYVLFTKITKNIKLCCYLNNTVLILKLINGVIILYRKDTLYLSLEITLNFQI